MIVKVQICTLQSFVKSEALSCQYLYFGHGLFCGYIDLFAYTKKEYFIETTKKTYKSPSKIMHLSERYRQMDMLKRS